jgi:hypothetical protein
MTQVMSRLSLLFNVDARDTHGFPVSMTSGFDSLDMEEGRPEKITSAFSDIS